MDTTRTRDLDPSRIPAQRAGRQADGGPRWQILARHDLPASLVVLLVAIPLSLGIAAASGAPLMAGIVAAVVGGVVVGAIGGAPLQVSGPAAGLTVVVANLVAQHGWAATTAMVALAGVVQVALGLTRVGRAALLLSPAVVHGMLAGIGIVIALSQLHVVLGGAPQRSAWENLRELPAQLVGYHDAAVLVGVVTIGVLLLWSQLVKTLFLPAPLVAVAGATALATGMGLDLDRVVLPDNPLGVVAAPHWPDAAPAAIANGVLMVALVASVESLLSAVAVDKLHDGPRANLDRELLAQGVANTASGLLGGLPVTGVIVRSSTNVAAGARTRAATILHGAWIALFVLLLAGVLELIPMSALAGVLVIVGLRLISVAHIRTLVRHRELPAYAVTVVGVVFVDLVTGVLLGMAVALASALYRLTHWRIEVEPRSPDGWQVRITGTLLFLGVRRLTEHLRRLPSGQRVHLELHLDFLDHAAFEAMRDWRTGYERRGGRVDVEEVHDTWFDRAVRDRLGVRKSLPDRTPRWLAGWSEWQSSGSAPPDGRPGAPAAPGPGGLLLGVREFQRRVAPFVRPGLVELARHGQRPRELFITCADSRMVPNLVTASGPGDLFCLRNIGNIVPRHGTPGDHSVGAAIEYATEVLNVSTITVCGHSDCGAMNALLNDGAGNGTHLASWLDHARAGDRAGGAVPPTGEDLPAVERHAVANVARQLENLRTYPGVRGRLDDNRLRLVGMYFDLHEARMYLVDAGTGTRRPVPG